MIELILSSAAGLVAGVLLAWLLLRAAHRRSLAAALETERAALATEKAAIHERAAERLEKDLAAREKILREGLESDHRELRAQAETLKSERAEVERERQRLEKRDQTLGQREESLSTKQSMVDRRDNKLREREETLEVKEKDIADRITKIAETESIFEARLAEVAKLSPEDAKKELLSRLESQLADDMSRRIQAHERTVTEKAKEMSAEIMVTAMQRYAAECTQEGTVSRVVLASEDLKGRIIGKEGRNIRCFEQAAGVDLIIDDTPGAITISCFDGVRREIARRTLSILLEDGRVQPARIEEVLNRQRQEMDQITLKAGEDAAYECEVSGIHPQLLRILGKLLYRTSYGQNVLQHTKEVAFLAGAIAAELGLDQKLARRAGLLHDIGKAIDLEQEGSHTTLGAEALKRFGEPANVVNAALAHHDEHGATSIYTTLVAAADAISAARPGARRESAERYIKRLEQMEEIACRFKGVAKAWAIQAGRELRIIINAQTITDAIMPKLARDIAQQVQAEVTFPGEIRINLIREVRAQALAR